MLGRVEAIHISQAAGAPMEANDAVEAIAGGGLAGDRYQTGAGFYSARPRADGGREVTLIEAEALAALAAEHGITLTAADSRPNLTTRGVRLTGLIGRRFRIGEVVCEGIDDCPPCQHLVEVTGRPVLAPLVGQAVAGAPGAEVAPVGGVGAGGTGGAGLGGVGAGPVSG